MNVPAYEKPHNVTPRVWERTCRALSRRAIWHAEGREHSRLTEVLPSRVMDSVLRSLVTHPCPFQGEEEYRRAALRRYESFLNKSLNRDRARLLQGPVVSASYVPEHCAPGMAEQARQNSLNPQVVVLRGTLPDESALIACLLETGLEEYLAYIWLWRCWQGCSYKEARVRLHNTFGIACDVATLRQWVRRHFVENVTRMAEFYRRVWGEEATADMLARLRAPRRARQVPRPPDTDSAGIQPKPTIVNVKSAAKETSNARCKPRAAGVALSLLKRA